MDIKATPYSGLKIFAHPEKIDAIKNGDRVSPVYIRIKPTNVCNHHCYYCSYADNELGLRDNIDHRDQIPKEKMFEIINDLGDMGVKAVTFSGGGEPLVYPYITETMGLVRDKGIDLSVITNGQLLTGRNAEILSDAKWVRISFDSSRAESYAKIRGIPIESFEKVCRNISEFSNKKSKDCELGVNFVINHENYDQIYEMASMVKNLGVNHIKYCARITKDLDEYHEKFRLKAIEQIHKAIEEFSDEGFTIINKYEDDFLYSTVFHRVYSKCYIKDIFTVIAADSRVYFCHDKAYVNDGIVADLKDKSFKEIWFSNEVQERYRKFDAKKECNHHCVYDDRNMLINSFLSLDKNHINFI